MERTKLFSIIAIIASVILIATFSVLIMQEPSGEKEAAVRPADGIPAAERSAEDKEAVQTPPPPASPQQKDAEAELEDFAQNFESRYGWVSIMQFALSALNFAAIIWIAVMAFSNDGVLPGLLCLCCCPYTLYYGISRFQLVKKPFIIWIVSLLIGIILGVFVMGDIMLTVNQIMQTQGG